MRMNVNEKIKQYLQDHGIKQTFLAEKTGIAQEKLSRMLSKNRKLSADELVKISNALGVNPNIFLD